MNSIHKSVGLLMLGAACLTASTARATDVRLGLGADYSFGNNPYHDGTGVFSVLLQVNEPLVRHLSVGGRFGAMYLASPQQLGVPADLSIRLQFEKLYLEGLAGPWIIFRDGSPIQAHAGFGFGLQTSSISLGAEVGYFDHAGIAGVRLEFRL